RAASSNTPSDRNGDVRSDATTRRTAIRQQSPLRNEVLSPMGRPRQRRENGNVERNNVRTTTTSSAAAGNGSVPTRTQPALSSRFAPAHRHPAHGQSENGYENSGTDTAPPLPDDFPLPWLQPSRMRPMSPFSRQYNRELRATLAYFVTHGELPE
ncbi:hypothetical protein KEM54_005002, partial [Ascosphaera aggregata]